MGIDITKIPNGQLLAVLGQGDWVIALPGDYPDLVVTAAWRQLLVDDTARRFVRWALRGIRYRINHDDDPPWDSSGNAERESLNTEDMLSLYETLDEWMEDELTGNSMASYVSGMGLYWQTYGEDIQIDLHNELAEYLKQNLLPKNITDQNTLWDLWDQTSEAIDPVDVYLEEALLEAVGLMPTRDAWRNYKSIVQAQIETERVEAAEQAARYREMDRQVRAFWRQHYPGLDGVRIEKPQFKALKMADSLADKLADTDPLVVEAIASLGLPGNFSNSVKMIIALIAKRALEDDALDESLF